MPLKKIALITLFLFGTLFYAVSADKNPTIVIDPGHGGRSPGAVVNRVLEKNINLTVALMVGQRIKNILPSCKIIYTRTDDREVTLNARTEIANRSNADIFISIHCNANPSTSARGSETYVMGVSKSESNLAVAMLENSVITLEQDYTQSYGGYDPSSAESFIVFSLMQYAHQDKSLSLACQIQDQFTAHQALRSRGVKQDGFLVLWRTAMPSVLIELGFMSNPTDLAYLTSATGQQTMANAIAQAATWFVSQNKIVAKPQTTTSRTPTTATTVKSQNTTPKSDVQYRVQIKTSKSEIPINSMNFGQWVVKIKLHKAGNLYKYSVGELFSYKEALTLQRKLQTTYHDCFVVAYQNDQQISLEKANQILGQ